MGCLFSKEEMDELAAASKAAKGDLGEATCISVLSDYGVTVKNLNSDARNRRGIDLTFQDKTGVFLGTGGIGAVQCRGGIRNPYNKDGTRPEWDGSMVRKAKIAKAEQEAAALKAPLFWSIAYFYPHDEENTLLFFFLATNEFMRSPLCSRNHGYRFYTHHVLNRYGIKPSSPSADGAKGLLFRMRVYQTQDIRKIKTIAEQLNIERTIESFMELPYMQLKKWQGHQTNYQNLDYVEIPFLKG